MRLSLAQALDLEQAEVDDLGRDDLALTAGEVRAAGALWLALLDIVDDGGAAARQAWAEVTGDRALCVLLHRDAVALLETWRGLRWADFPRSDGPGGVAWAWDVMDRLRACVAVLGPLAGQRTVSAWLAREVCSKDSGMQAGGPDRIGAAGA